MEIWIPGQRLLNNLLIFQFLEIGMIAGINWKYVPAMRKEDGAIG